MTEPTIEILLVQQDQQQIDLTLDVIQANHLANRIHVLRDGGDALEFLFRTGPYANRQPVNPRLVLFHLRLGEPADIQVLSRLANDPRTSCIPVTVLALSSRDRGAAMTVLRDRDLHFPVAVIARPMPHETIQALVTAVSDATGDRQAASEVGDPTTQNADLTQLCLERDLQAVLRVARGAAHQFNNVLSEIVAYTEMLLRDMDLDDPRRAGAEEIFRSIARASRLTRELLAFCPTVTSDTTPPARAPAPRPGKPPGGAGPI